MLLVIDAGNTNVKLGVFRGAKLLGQWRLATDTSRAAEEYASEVQGLFERAKLSVEEVEGMAIASVVPPLNPLLTSMSERLFGVTPLFVDHTTETGLTILYNPPSDLGADRIVIAVAAVAKYGAPCIVVGCGTATTFNVVNAWGEFIGGAISPGLMTCNNALFERAAKLPRVEFERPEKVIGSSTTEAMQSGIYHGYAGLVDGVLEKMIEELGGKPRIVATGGLAPLLAPASQYIDQVDDTLTLEGLQLVYALNVNHGNSVNPV
jgi:type III pantothenate kinase